MGEELRDINTRTNNPTEYARNLGNAAATALASLHELNYPQSRNIEIFRSVSRLREIFMSSEQRVQLARGELLEVVNEKADYSGERVVSGAATSILAGRAWQSRAVSLQRKTQLPGYAIDDQGISGTKSDMIILANGFVGRRIHEWGKPRFSFPVEEYQMAQWERILNMPLHPGQSKIRFIEAKDSFQARDCVGVWEGSLVELNTLHESDLEVCIAGLNAVMRPGRGN